MSASLVVGEIKAMLWNGVIGLQAKYLSVTSLPGADRIRLTDDQQRAGSARDLPQRDMITSIGMNDADAGYRGFG